MPTESFTVKLRRLDWTGNILFIAFSTRLVLCLNTKRSWSELLNSAVLGLTFAGGEYEWTSAAVLVPLVLGVVGLTAFLFYEWSGRPTEPMIPKEILTHWTAIAGHFTTFLHGIFVLAVLYYRQYRFLESRQFTNTILVSVPLYFQAAKGHSPIRTGIDLFSKGSRCLPKLILILICHSFVFYDCAIRYCCRNMDYRCQDI